MTLRITETSGNRKNGIRGQRLSFYVDGELKDRFVVPSMYGAKRYCQQHPSGEYGKRYFANIEKYSK